MKDQKSDSICKAQTKQLVAQLLTPAEMETVSGAASYVEHRMSTGDGAKYVQYIKRPVDEPKPENGNKFA